MTHSSRSHAPPPLVLDADASALDNDIRCVSRCARRVQPAGSATDARSCVLQAADGNNGYNFELTEDLKKAVKQAADDVETYKLQNLRQKSAQRHSEPTSDAHAPTGAQHLESALGELRRRCLRRTLIRLPGAVTSLGGRTTRVCSCGVFRR